MSLVNRPPMLPWSQFQIDAEVDAFGTARIVANANAAYAALKEAEGEIKRLRELLDKQYLRSTVEILEALTDSTGGDI